MGVYHEFAVFDLMPTKYIKLVSFIIINVNNDVATSTILFLFVDEQRHKAGILFEVWQSQFKAVGVKFKSILVYAFVKVTSTLTLWANLVLFSK